MWKIWILIVFSFCGLNSPIRAKQHKIIDQIRGQYYKCGSDCFFSLGQIQSKNRSKFYKDEILELLPNAPNNFIRAELIENLNLIPVNNCVLRGNRHYYLPENQELLEKLRVKNIITMDALVNKRHQKHNNSERVLIYLPVSPKKYPNAQSLNSIIKALDYLSQSTDTERAYISCFYGKHRTGLVIGLYQFVRNYIASPALTCEKVATPKDEAFLQMNAIADLGILTYDMPSDYLKFYRDFALSVCQEQSQEFIESL